MTSWISRSVQSDMGNLTRLDTIGSKVVLAVLAATQKHTLRILYADDMHSLTLQYVVRSRPRLLLSARSMLHMDNIVSASSSNKTFKVLRFEAPGQHRCTHLSPET